MPNIDSGLNFAEILFYLVFLSQVLLISFYFPRRIKRQTRCVIEKYPPSDYPKLYPKPIEYYERALRNFGVLNHAALVVGLLAVATLAALPGSGQWGETSDFFSHSAIAGWYFFLQFIPILLMDMFSVRNLKRMRNATSTRKAELQPRRLLDFVSPALLGAGIFTYLAFVAFVAYMNQFGFEWFGGYLNVLGITVANLFFAGIMAYQIYGKRQNPHQSYEDRKRQIETLARIMVFISIAATVFVALSVTLSALDLRHLEPIGQSLYFQLMALLAFRAYRIDRVNFAVYKEDAVVA